MQEPVGGLLALDLATVVGWATCPLDYRPRTPLEVRHLGPAAGVFHGSWRVAPVGTPLAPFLDRFATGLDNMIALHAPSILVFEAPIMHAGHTSIDTARRLMGMACVTELIAYRRQIATVRECNVATVKKHWTGSGRAEKADMIRAARERGFEPKDDNAADALALMDLAAASFLKRRAA